MKEGFRRAGQRASQDHNMAPCQIAPSSGPLPPQSLEVISRSIVFNSSKSCVVQGTQENTEP